MPNFIAIKTYFTRLDAQVAHGLLEDSGIQSFVSGDDAGGFHPHLSLSTNNFRLMILPEDSERAEACLQILEEEINE